MAGVWIVAERRITSFDHLGEVEYDIAPGEVAQLRQDQAERWSRRGAATIHDSRRAATRAAAAAGGVPDDGGGDDPGDDPGDDEGA